MYRLDPQYGGRGWVSVSPHVTSRLRADDVSLSLAMIADPALAFKAIRTVLKCLDAELYDDSIPFEETHRRMISVSEAAAHAVVSKLGGLPEPLARRLALAVRAANRRDLLAAREFILEALDEAATAH